MKLPAQPPDLDQITGRLAAERGRRFIELVTGPYLTDVASAPYRPWDELRNRTPPEGLDHEEWWLVTKLARASLQRTLPLVDANGRRFTYALPDEALKAIEEVSRQLSGRIGAPEQVTNPATRDRYVVSSLMEEAISSSQLEGASTTRAAAKDLIRSGRSPRDKSERMVFNNYLAMRRIGELRETRITIDLLLELHRLVTDDTLDTPDAAGRFQLPDEERVGVYYDDKLVYQPPAADLLPARLERLCAFVNDELGGPYVPGVVRAIIAHFMLGYEHPFQDGNGRTARALFYWIMLQQGSWLTEFISISRLLNNAPAQYARSFLHTELDDNDLTYFILYQLKVIGRAIVDLNEYLDRKTREVREFQQSLALMSGEFNHRQIALLQNALHNPGRRYTVHSHGASHNVVRQTARQDLKGLEARGLLHRHNAGKGFVWIPVADLVQRLQG